MPQRSVLESRRRRHLRKIKFVTYNFILFILESVYKKICSVKKWGNGLISKYGI